MARPASPSGFVGPELPGSFIVVPPNGRRYEDPDVIRRLESLIRKRLPLYAMQLHGSSSLVSKPSPSSSASQGGQTNAKEAILRELNGFDPNAPELKPD